MGNLCGGTPQDDKKKKKEKLNPSFYKTISRPVASKEDIRELLKRSPCFCHDYNANCTEPECSSLRDKLEVIGYMGLQAIEQKIPAG